MDKVSYEAYETKVAKREIASCARYDVVAVLPQKPLPSLRSMIKDHQ